MPKSDGKQRLATTSLEDLKSVVFSPAALVLPTVDAPIEDAEARAEQIRQGAGTIRAWMITALEQLGKFDRLSREARESMGMGLQETRLAIKDRLHDSVLAYRRGALLGMFTYEFGRSLGLRTEAEELFGRLVTEGYLLETPSGPSGDLKVYNKTYRVVDVGFNEQELEQIQNMVTGLLARVYAETGKQRATKATQLQGRASINLADLVAGKPGICAILVPAEFVGSNGSAFWRGGGTLLVETNGSQIAPLDASGAIEGGMKEARDMGVHLMVTSLQWDKAPLITKLPQDMGAKVQLLWYLLKRAIKHQEQAARIEDQLNAFLTEATITPHQFFLEGASGICAVSYSGTWEQKSLEGEVETRVSDLFFNVKRDGENGERTICIVRIPDHLEGFFSHLDCSAVYCEAGPKFEGVAGPLKAILQACWRQTFEASKDAEKVLATS